MNRSILIDTVRHFSIFSVVVFLVLSIAGSRGASAQTSIYSYTGNLVESGTPANGSYDMQFGLFTAASGGTQVGSTISVNSVAVSAGTFSAQLDFSAAAFSGADRFLEISVRHAGGGGYTTLSPRTQITSSPYAVRALTVTGPVTGTSPLAALSVSNAQPGITNPSPANLPPAALRAEATSTTDSNVGLMGIGDGTTGLGVIGISNGIAPLNGQGNAGGVIGIATATSGKSVGVSANVSSPDGIAFQAKASNGGNLFVGANDGGNTFLIDGGGNLSTNGNIVSGGLVRGADIKSDSSFRAPNGAVFAQELHLNNNTIDAFNGTVGMSGSVVVTGSFSVTGAKNSIVKLPDERWVALSAMESPGTWFEDFGTIRLRNGRAVVRIDPTFADTANVGVPYMVYVTPDGNCRGLYVTRKTATGFEVRELGGGHSNVTIDYRIVAKRRGYENVRFAPVPKAAQPK